MGQPIILNRRRQVVHAMHSCSGLCGQIRLCTHGITTVGGVTAGHARHNKSNLGDVTTGQVRHDSSITDTNNT